MKVQTVIQKTTAFILLLLFLTGSLPKAYFHDLLADHIDFTACDKHHSTVVLHKQGVNCHFDDLVVSGPFVITTYQDYPPLNFVNEIKPVAYFTPGFNIFLQHKDNRGPPSLLFI